jgi:hypothetical protein
MSCPVTEILVDRGALIDQGKEGSMRWETVRSCRGKPDSTPLPASAPAVQPTVERNLSQRLSTIDEQPTGRDIQAGHKEILRPLDRHRHRKMTSLKGRSSMIHDAARLEPKLNGVDWKLVVLPRTRASSCTSPFEARNPPGISNRRDLSPSTLPSQSVMELDRR